MIGRPSANLPSLRHTVQSHTPASKSDRQFVLLLTCCFLCSSALFPSHSSADAAGVTDEEVDGDAFPLFAEGKSLISHYLYRELKEACGGVYWNRTSGSKCDTLYYKMTEELSSLNVYDVLHDVSAMLGGREPSTS